MGPPDGTHLFPAGQHVLLGGHAGVDVCKHWTVDEETGDSFGQAVERGEAINAAIRAQQPQRGALGGGGLECAARPRDQEEGIFSNTFAVRAAAGSEAEQLPAGEVSSDNTGMVAGIAGAMVGAAMLAIGIVLVVVIRRRRRSARERSASDAPLKAV